jgi:hypothetical protein
MAKQTLSIELDDGLLERVRRYSAEHGTDVAGMITDLIERLPESGTREAVGGPAARSGEAVDDEEDWVRALPPLTRSLLGAAEGDVDEDDYREYLWRKYGP